jgi:pimeloyl-ACP methyl ester carboxylesterase
VFFLRLQCAGFLPNDPEYAALLNEARVDVPALFIIGQADALIPPSRTQVGVLPGVGDGCSSRKHLLLLRHMGGWLALPGLLITVLQYCASAVCHRSSRSSEMRSYPPAGHRCFAWGWGFLQQQVVPPVNVEACVRVAWITDVLIVPLVMC